MSVLTEFQSLVRSTNATPFDGLRRHLEVLPRIGEKVRVRDHLVVVVDVVHFADLAVTVLRVK
jgi:hypothetical protein